MTKWIRIVHPNSYQYFSARTRELCQTHTSEHINAPGFISLHRVRHTRATRATITWPSVLSPGVSKLVGFFSSIPSRSPLIICVSVQASLRNCLNDLSHMSLSLSFLFISYWHAFLTVRQSTYKCCQTHGGGTFCTPEKLFPALFF